MPAPDAVPVSPLRLDATWLAEIGLGNLPSSFANELLAAAYSELEHRVGMELASAMSEAELDEFETFIDTDDEVGALAWLERKYPHYRNVVRRELNLLSGEIRKDAARIAASARSAARCEER